MFQERMEKKVRLWEYLIYSGKESEMVFKYMACWRLISYYVIAKYSAPTMTASMDDVTLPTAEIDNLFKLIKWLLDESHTIFN